jgi:hypothetical protein
MAVISLPNVLTSTVFCLLLYQIIGALLTNIKIPVWLRLVPVFPAKSASTKQCVVAALPLGGGMSPGIASSASL